MVVNHETKAQAPPVVNIEVQPAPVNVDVNPTPVNVAAPNVTIENQPAQVTVENEVHFPKRASEFVQVKRDAQGRIDTAKTDTVYEE